MAELKQYRSVIAVHYQTITGPCRSPVARVLTLLLALCLTCRTPARAPDHVDAVCYQAARPFVLHKTCSLWKDPAYSA